MYIDGSLDASLDTNTGICNIEEIGAQTNGSEKFDGILQEVSAWSVELSLAEIQELFNEGVALDATTIYPLVKEVETNAEHGDWGAYEIATTDHQSDPDGGTDAVLMTSTSDESAENDVYYYNHDNRSYVLGETYRFSVWLRTASTSSVKNHPFAITIREAASSPLFKEEITVTPVWTEYSVEATMTKASGTLDLYIGGYGYWRTETEVIIEVYNPRLYLTSGPAGYWRND